MMLKTARPGWSCRRRSFGFTLLEMLLALLISAVVMMAVGQAINLYMRLLTAGRDDVESAQLARTLLAQIAVDVQATVRYQAIDTSLFPKPVKANSGGSGSGGGSTSTAPGSGGAGSASSATNASKTGSTSAGGSTAGSSGVTAATTVTSVTSVANVLNVSNVSSGTSSGGSNSPASATAGGLSSGGGKASNSSSTGSTNSNSASSSDAATTETFIPPGLYGTATQLSIDASRLPRLFSPGADPTAALPQPAAGDLKTVTYFVTDPLAPGPLGSGLVRRELDRAATQFAGTQGASDTLSVHDEYLAPEVMAIAFRYYDGTAWVEEWDSNTNSAVPVAVEIGLTVAVPTANSPLAIPLNGRLVEPRLFRQVVAIAAALPATGSSGATSGPSDSGSSSTSASSTGSSTNAGS